MINFLLPFSETHIDTTIDSLSLNQAKALAASLSNRDSKGFEAAFGSLLASIPYQIHVPYEAYYQTVLIFALLWADQPYYAEQPTGEGRVDVSLRAADGSVHVIEIKHKKEPEAKYGGNPPAKDQIDKELRGLVDKAMAQIDFRKYAWPHQGGGAPVYKTALAVYGRTAVKIEFREAENWRLVETPWGSRVVFSESPEY